LEDFLRGKGRGGEERVIRGEMFLNGAVFFVFADDEGGVCGGEAEEDYGSGILSFTW
jgi:hypothetical protein